MRSSHSMHTSCSMESPSPRTTGLATGATWAMRSGPPTSGIVGAPGDDRRLVTVVGVALPAVQVRVQAVGGEELGVRALLHDAAVVEHEDPRRAADRREAVG